MYLPASTTGFYLVDTDRVWVEAAAQGNRIDLCAPRPAGDGHGRHLSGPQMARHRRQHRPGGAIRVLAAAGAEHQRQLGQGRPAHPVRVQIDAEKGMPPLRAGMSVEVSVDTGHKRGLPHFLTALFGGGRGSG